MDGGSMTERTFFSSESVTNGHPDKVCDQIADRILDELLCQDPESRVACEVTCATDQVHIFGEVTSKARFGSDEIAAVAREAVEKIGYTPEYQAKFGAANVVSGRELVVETHISHQSGDIAQGVNRDSWGDQGIFWGLAVDEPKMGYLPKDYFLARKLGQEIAGKFGGLDVKTLVTLEDGKPVECFIAIPLAPGEDDAPVIAAAKSLVGEDCRIVVNGTGRYVTHGSVGDCGTTGRKLVVDFYGGNSRIGGGSPWGKDPTKADVTLNVYARRCALEGMKRYGLPEMRCAISCCIGRRDIRVSLFDREMNLVEERIESDPASHVIELLGLDKPVYADTCARGLFGYETL